MTTEPTKGKRLDLLLRAKGAKRKKRCLLLLTLVLAVFSSLVYLLFGTHRSTSPPKGEKARIVEPRPEPAELEVIQGKIMPGRTLAGSLTEKHIPAPWVHLIVSKLKSLIDFRKMREGTYRLVTDREGRLIKFSYSESPTEVYEIEREGLDYRAKKREIPLESRLVRVTGVIQGSLFEAMESIGEKDALALEFAEILAWEVDFYKDVREGDRFQVIVEKLYSGDEFIRYGRIHGVAYESDRFRVRGIEYQGCYYHEEGSSLKRAFLRSPLRFSRISSRFSRARRHPILGGTSPHYGVDYAAPQGTPVWAVADGVVVGCGWNGGFGHQVILRHMNGYQTYYGHLSRYGPGIRLGTRVRQKQVIGYVGSTGLSTGPHLDYRLMKDGRFRNPLRERFPTGLSIPEMERGAFEKRRDEIVAWLNGEVPVGGKDRGGDAPSPPRLDLPGRILYETASSSSIDTE